MTQSRNGERNLGGQLKLRTGRTAAADTAPASIR
jgi:hypothetical protein